MFVRTTSWVASLVVVLLAGAGSADADGTPKPVITGTAQAGETLAAAAAWGSEPPARVAWQWLRCDAVKPATCRAIKDATTDRYRVPEADVGYRIRVSVAATGGDGTTTSERSEATDVVQAPPAPAPDPPPPSPAPDPPPPSPAPEPSPSPSPAPRPSPSQVSAPSTGSWDTSVPPPVSGDTPPRLLDPFPIVRIRGALTRAGARVTLLTVRGPRAVQIQVRCRGRSCPRRRLAVTAAVTRLRSFEGELRAGTRLVVKVVRPGWIGKWTVITIRRGAPPHRKDRCIYPGGRRPVRCPAS